MDVYNGSDGQPEVTHGHTLVRPMRLKAACQAINDYAFEASPWPVGLIYLSFLISSYFAVY